MATADQYAQWIVENSAKKGTPEFDTVAKAYEQAKAEESVKPTETPKETPFQAFVRGLKTPAPIPSYRGLPGSSMAGAIGETAKSLGAATELVAPETGKAITEAGRAMIEGSQQISPVGTFVGQVGSYIAPVAGAEKALGLSREAIRQAAPTLSSLRALQTPTTLAGRVAEGATLGGATTFLTTPGEATSRLPETAIGTTFGAALPAVSTGLSKLLRGPEQPADLASAVQRARELGYVIPPTQARGSLINRAIEGTSGKAATAQNASARNQEITNKLTAKSLGLPEDTVITGDVLKGIRAEAGKAYDVIGDTGVIMPKQSYYDALDNIKKPFVSTQQSFPGQKPSPVIELADSLKSDYFDSAAAVQKIKQLRTAADDAFRTGNTEVARASKEAANVLEDAVEDHLKTIGNPELLKNFRDARQLIAKTYTVEKAANTVTGTIDARKLAAQLKKGKPLNEELKDVAEFGARFPKATQPTETMGSLPQISPLDVVAGVGGSAVAGNAYPAMAIAGRPLLRELALSSPVQNRLVQPPKDLAPTRANLAKLLMMQQATQGE